MSSYMQRKNLGGLSIVTTKNSINISDESLDSPVRFERLKYLHFVKTDELYLFTNPINDLFALFVYEKKVYYLLLQRNVNQFHAFHGERFIYVIGIHNNITIYSFEKIMNHIMDNSLHEDVEEITALPGSPKKKLIQIPFEDLCIFSKSISLTNNNMEFYDNFVLIKSDVVQSPELLEISILHLYSFKTYLFRIEKIRTQILYNDNIFSFYANEGLFKNIVYIVSYFDDSLPGNIGFIMRLQNEGTAPHFKTATLNLHE
jgi:hypothetical protein